MKLSVLVCGLIERLEDSRHLFRHLQEQVDEFRFEAELLVLLDDRGMAVGTKRNRLVDLAQGRYVAFVDDDDWVEDDYVARLLQAAESGDDVLCFQADVRIDDGPVKRCDYSITFRDEGEDETHYWRWPNHLCAIKRDLVLRRPFPAIDFGEDSLFARDVRPLLHGETLIPHVLYHYRYSSVRTATQRPT